MSNSNTADILIDLIQPELRNTEWPQVFKASNGAKIVYFPPSEEEGVQKGYKNPNSKTITLISPNGARVEVDNYNAFCKDIFGENSSGKGKYSSSICHLVRGTRSKKDVNGWKLAS